MRKTTLLLTAMVTAIVLTSGAVLVSVGPAGAAYPGENGEIAVAYGDIYTMNPNGTGQVNLTRNNRLEDSPVWSPDGKKIAYTKFEEGWHVWVMKADGSDQTRLAEIKGEDAHSLTWSPDGRRLAFSRDGDIWTMRFDGSYQRRFTDDPRFESDPAWSPDGTRIAFWRSPDKTCCAAPDIWVKKVDGSKTIRLTRDPHGLASDGGADWSPDSRKIAFVSTRHGDLESSGRIYVMRAFPESDANRPQRLTGGTWETSDGQPAFSPDGSKIVFRRYGSGTRPDNDIFIMNANGSDKRSVPTAFGYPSSPNWQPLP